MEYLVSIRLMTYNHAPYIAEAMDGIMMQKVDFPVEVIVGDDFSEDGTLYIIKQYEDTQNIHIKILEREKGDEYWLMRQERGRLHNFFNILENCRGKYIALLDGDDYWTDPLKLQKQVEFMERNDEYVGCFTNYKMVNKEGETITEEARLKDQASHYDRLSMLEGGVPQTCTVMYRNISSVLREVAQFNNVVNGDQVLSVFMAQEGKIKFINEVTASRRLESGSYTTLTKEKRTISTIETFIELKKYLKKKDEIEVLNRRINNRYSNLIFRLVLSGNIYKAIIYNKERKERTGLPFMLNSKKIIKAKNIFNELFNQTKKT